MELALKLAIPLAIWCLASANESRQIEIAQENQKDAVVREYIKEMKGMLLDKKVAKEARQPGSQANGVARALTQAALAQLKGEQPERRTLVFQFLRESNFPILQGANLGNHDLRGSNLFGAKLDRAFLYKANLEGTFLKEANLEEASLYKANLKEAILYKAKLYKANLKEADLRRANLNGADLREADLRKALFWETICPDGTKTNKGCPVPAARQ